MKHRIDWERGDVQEQVDGFFREDVVALVEDYRVRGDAAIPDYADKPKPLHAGEGFDFLLRESPLLFQYLPDFFGSIRDFPGDLPGNVEDFIFWSVEKPGSGLKETFFLTHAFLHRSATKDGHPVVSIAQKRLFASHYYYGALRFATVVDYTKGAGSRSCLVFLDRHLFDAKLGGLKKKMLRKGVRERLTEELTIIRRGVDEAYRASSGG